YAGKLDRALPQMRRAQEVDPVSPITNGALGYMLMMARQYDESVRYARRALELDPAGIFGDFNLGESYLGQGQYDDALAEFQQIPEEQHLDALQAIGITYALAGRRAEAQQVVAELTRLYSIGMSQGRLLGLCLNLALIDLELGDKKGAFEWLE